MWTCFVLVIVVPVVAATGWGVYSYRKFSRTPAFAWRTRVLRRAGELKREYRAVRNSGRPADHAAAERRLFAEHLAGVPAGVVEQFPGIGRGTVDRLYSAGLRTLADLIDYPFHHLSGFGPSRTADLRSAVKQLLADARRNFDAGDCAKGREFRQHRQRVEQRQRQEDAVRDAKLAELSAELDALKPHVRTAETITWVRYLRQDGQFPELSADSRDEPVARRESHEQSGTAGTEDDASVEVVVIPRNGSSSPMPPPNSPVPALDVTIQCATCDARLKVTSSKRRTQFRVTCPRCGAASSVTMPAAAPLPVIQPAAKPVPPPTPVPANAPLAAKLTAFAPPTPPRMSPPAVPKPTPQPVDLFAESLASSSVASQPVADRPELARLRTFAGFGLMIAKADGRIAKAERAAVRDFLASLFGHDPALARHIDPVIEATEKVIPGENEAIANVIRRSSPAEWKPLYLAAVRIADACGKRNRQETELLERIAAGLGVEGRTITAARRGTAEATRVAEARDRRPAPDLGDRAGRATVGRTDPPPVHAAVRAG